MAAQRASGFPSIDKPWMKYYEYGMTDQPRPHCSIYEYMYNSNKEHPSDIAIYYVNRKISYGKLFENIDSCAKAFLALGVKPGEIVTIASVSVPETLYAIYALNRIGAVANMIHPLAGEDEIVDYLNEVGSRVCVLFTGTYNIVGKSLGRTSVEKAIVVSPAESMRMPLSLAYKLRAKEPKLPAGSDVINWKTFIAGGKDTELVTYERDLDSVALISHTGGTTGEPKGVMASDNNVNSVLWQTVCRMHVPEGTIFMSVLPPFVSYSLMTSMLQPLSIGCATLLIPKYNPNAFDMYVRRYHPNYIISIPAYWEAVCDNPKLRTRLEMMDLSCLELCAYGGEAMNPEKEIEVNHILLQRGAKGKLMKALGATESMSLATLTYEEVNELTSVGIPLIDINCKIVDPETGDELPINHVGEICFSGPTIMLGYYNKPEATANALRFHTDGKLWLHMGDLGRLNEDGVLFVTGRIKRIVMTKGKDGQVTKLFPDRIEKVIDQHPDVSACCVIGVPDDTRINYAVVYVEPRRGKEPSEEFKKDILDFCSGRLPEYQIPDDVMFIDSFPRTNRDKVDYRALEEAMKKKIAKEQQE